jgi:carbon dioxide concentrating mechanism protein CcmM
VPKIPRFRTLLSRLLPVTLLFAALGSAGQKGGLTRLWLRAPITVNSSFITPLVELYGDVSIGHGSFVAGNTVLRADPGTRVRIGSDTNLQDNVTVLALRRLPFPVPAAPGQPRTTSIADRVSLAHQAVIKNSRIGRFTFIGFRARVTRSVIEEGAFILHGATVTGVRVPCDRLVPAGAVITRQAQANALPRKSPADAEFQRDVLEVNEEFGRGYARLYQQRGFGAVTGVSIAPATSWNSHPLTPTLGPGVRIEEFARVVGDVRLGARSVVGRRTAVRADEGAPIVIGENARIGDHVTFHALKGTAIRIGNTLHTGDNIVFHGPLTVGDALTIGDDAVLFRSKVGRGVTIGRGAIVVGVTLPDSAQVPENAVVTAPVKSTQRPGPDLLRRGVARGITRSTAGASERQSVRSERASLRR